MSTEFHQKTCKNVHNDTIYEIKIGYKPNGQLRKGAYIHCGIVTQRHTTPMPHHTAMEVSQSPPTPWVKRKKPDTNARCFIPFI